MTALWIAWARDHDSEAEALQVMVTDGAEQCHFVLHRSTNATLYDFIVSHRREPSP
jgi:hypothetical protein